MLWFALALSLSRIGKIGSLDGQALGVHLCRPTDVSGPVDALAKLRDILARFHNALDPPDPLTSQRRTSRTSVKRFGASTNARSNTGAAAGMRAQG